MSTRVKLFIFFCRRSQPDYKDSRDLASNPPLSIVSQQSVSRSADESTHYGFQPIPRQRVPEHSISTLRSLRTSLRDWTWPNFTLIIRRQHLKRSNSWHKLKNRRSRRRSECCCCCWLSKFTSYVHFHQHCTHIISPFTNQLGRLAHSPRRFARDRKVLVSYQVPINFFIHKTALF